RTWKAHRGDRARHLARVGHDGAGRGPGIQEGVSQALRTCGDRGTNRPRERSGARKFACVMHTLSLLDDQKRAALAREVQARGLAPVARELRIARSTLASVLARSAREATETMVALRLAERPNAPARRRS